MKKLILILTIALSLTAMAATRSSKKDISRSLDIFTAVFKQLQTSYVDSIDAEKTVTKAINAMLADIDPYTNYIPEEEQESFMTISTGTYGGIGSMIMQRDGHVYVSEPYENTPASRAGLRAGDRFLMIDSVNVEQWTSDSISNRLRGQAGTPLTVTVERPFAADSVLTFNLTRAKVEIPSVPYYGMVTDSIGYISLTTFNEHSADDVRKALIELKKNPEFSGVILDLRDNGGGVMESAIKIVGLFTPKGTEVLRTRGRGQFNEQLYKTTNSPVDTKLPLAVLINEGSASSSEIVAGALQDLDRAVIIGQRSFGKGLVQSTRQLPYNGLLKVTIAKYYIPSGRLIQAIDYSHRNPDGSPARIPDSLTSVFHTASGRPVRDGGGITPDVAIELPEASRTAYNIVTSFSIFDFATEYAAAHDSIPVPSEFEIDDAIYAQFKASVDTSQVQYDKLTDTFLDEFRNLTKREGYLTDSVSAQIETLRNLLRHDLDSDLDIHRDEIAKYLAAELLQRYYFQKGVTEWNSTHDSTIARAAAILTAPARYRALLTPSKD
ncbi:MAG: S41 family peptidase [Muribaculaceae bacterium]|nr:S41 family peptidase [Muribaculaceae bacterium]